MLRSSFDREVQELRDVLGVPFDSPGLLSGQWRSAGRPAVHGVDYLLAAFGCRETCSGRSSLKAVSGSAGGADGAFSTMLIDWQTQHGRHDLPWQKTRDPYRIWLAEIMLQQTQVATVIPYFARFLERFASVDALAQAPLDAVLELWAGLGYYARARNLHRCAQTLVAQHDGKFPREASAIAQLPGIGRSTAAAVSAFAFGARAAILDGNVKRVLARCFGVEGFPGAAQTEREMWALAESLLPPRGIEAYTQGLMDLGSTVCTRSKPRCAVCPMSATCVARRTGRQAELPVAKPKKVLPERQTALLLLSDGQRVLLERRPPTGIWGGLLTLPEGGHAEPTTFALRHGCRLLETRELPLLRHTFTHFRLNIRTLWCRVEASSSLAGEGCWQWLDHGAIETAALPTPIRFLLRTMVSESMPAGERQV